MSGERRESETTLALASYILALDALQRASPVTPRLAAVCAVEILTLRTILANVPNLDAAKKLAADKQIGERLFGALQKRPSHGNALSYICSVTPCAYTDTVANSSEQDAAKIWAVVDSPRFLQVLVWLLVFNKDLRSSSLSFMEVFLNALPEEPDSNNLHAIGETSLSRKDVKVLLIACARWAELQWDASVPLRLRETPAPPPLFFVRPPYAISKFWNALLLRVDSKQRLNTASLIAISSALELTRLRTKIPDVRIVDAMRRWLATHGDAQRKWACLCSSVAVALIKGTMCTTCKEPSADAVLPYVSNQAISTALEEEIFDDASRFLDYYENSNTFGEVFKRGSDASKESPVHEKVIDNASVGGMKKSEQMGATFDVERPPLLLARLELAAKLIVEPRKNGVKDEPKQQSVLSSNSHRHILSLRDFLELRRFNDQLAEWLNSHQSKSSPREYDRCDGAGSKDELMSTALNAEKSFQQQQDKFVESMVCMLNATPTASSAVLSSQSDMQSLVAQAYMNGVYTGWGLYEQSLSAYQQQQQLNGTPSSLSHGIRPVASHFVVASESVPAASAYIAPAHTTHNSPTSAIQFYAPDGHCGVPPTLMPQRAVNVEQTMDEDKLSSALNTKNECLPHDPSKCLGCSDENVQDEAFRFLDHLADNYKP
ncbi:hypothetical protein Tcan_04064 [Toxocara canis]|nr:hypothetical protein Tcan_04064 [Toxocara canis]